MLYLDYSATTPMFEEVIEVITAAMRTHYGNASSLHRLGIEAEQLLNQSRKSIAGLLNCSPNEIVFTSGGTESNNLALKGTAFARKKRGNHLITSQIEHASVIESSKQLERQGFRVTCLPVDRTGSVLVEDVRAAIDDDTTLVSLMHVNNEMGRIQPVEAVGKLLQQFPKITYHVDAIQSMGKLPVIPQQIGADLLSLSAHKFGGPKGAGILYRRSGLELRPELTGGGQEFGLRSGTENVALIAGMAKALQITMDRRAEKSSTMYRLREKLLNRIQQMDGFCLTGSDKMEEMAPQIVHFCIPGMRAEVVIHALEQFEIYISTRSACSSGLIQPSRVLMSMGMDAEIARTGLRVSFSADQTLEEMDYFLDCLHNIIQELKKPMQAYSVAKQKNRRR
jgi:cysteine desulfurase